MDIRNYCHLHLNLLSFKLQYVSTSLLVVCDEVKMITGNVEALPVGRAPKMYGSALQCGFDIKKDVLLTEIQSLWR